ncbi:hypothetical protein GQ55_3G106300 [Panicum hallii var. hallii]|uniref:Uncharacterized protein n=1 Tax=Panicum hallii var. hallii TaxID=1504633 RepID=A0A2T7E7Z0_9POAL|nr:hypothetical protein GQ55_3G106300 [Panicum hallii var. hallii]
MEFNLTAANPTMEYFLGYKGFPSMLSYVYHHADVIWSSCVRADTGYKQR